MPGASAILSATERRQWFALSYDVWLGRLSRQHVLRIFHWGCTAPLRHNTLRSTVPHSGWAPRPRHRRNETARRRRTHRARAVIGA
eukprot:3319229-Prymnesium_polylepis.2